ncbi:5,6-dimethylbenzimidazole synthase [Bacterioplanoides sp.]|uniref:5,6-dimethylbenzimidazole synthase n=1 Tax=Bacterioplanoides sp. TaxID=2066072 RepID=UPI003B5A95BE
MPDRNQQFSTEQSDLLMQMLAARRDVRGNRFLADELDQSDIDKILKAALHAPSVGFSQPWEFVLVKDKQSRCTIAESFFEENEKALQQFRAGNYDAAKLEQYQALKLEGIVESPLNIAVFYNPKKGPVLGQTSMPEMGRYSVVCAVQNMWLMARSLNIGIGWVSILDPQKVKAALNAPQDRELVAYLCVGKVDKFYDQPELETLGWEERKAEQQVVLSEGY